MTTRFTTRMLLAAVMLTAWAGMGPMARAEDKAPTNQDLAKGQEELKAELANVKSELANVRGDLQKILAQLNAMKTQPPVQQVPNPNQPQPPKADTTVYDLPLGTSPVLGAKDAKVTIVEFSDLQCPFCQKEYPKIQQVLKDYPNDVKFVVKSFPLSFHKQAKPAAAALALAAKKSHEAYWKMHDQIVANPKAMAVEDLRKYAEGYGMDLKEFDAVMADEKQQDELIKADMELAAKTGVRGTPTVLINGVKMASRNPDDYKNRIDEILKGGAPKAEKAEPKPQVIELKPAAPDKKP
jgi:protein-disulfide isomerase